MMANASLFICEYRFSAVVSVLEANAVGSLFCHPLDEKGLLPNRMAKHHMPTTVACSHQSEQGGWETP